MKILIVVEDTVERQRLQDFLAERGDVTVCPTGDDAIREVRKLEEKEATEAAQAATTSRGPRLVASNGGPAATNVSEVSFSGGRGMNDVVEEIESRMIAQAMTKTGNNQIKASEMLGITRGALQYKLKKYRLPKRQAA